MMLGTHCRLSFYKWFLISKDPFIRSQLIESKKIYFSPPHEKHLYFKRFLDNNSKTIKFSKKVIDNIFVKLKILHLLVYL